MSNSIIVDPPNQQSDQASLSADPNKQLVQWVMSRVDRWRSQRDNNFKNRWDEYYRLWRGRWSKEDKNRDSERSRMIAPALAQAIEMTVAEMEEATFGREQWFDVFDPGAQDAGATACRDQLLSDFARANVADAIAMCYLNGALYGNGIAKIVVDAESNPINIYGQGSDPSKATPIAAVSPSILIRIEAIPADEFVPDPAGRTIEEMLGCAHEVYKPRHYIDEMAKKGFFYKDLKVSGMPELDGRSIGRADLEAPLTSDDTVFITEYHGFVPARMLPKRGASPVDAILDAPNVEDGDGPMIEAIVTIANRSTLLRGVANPFTMKDRSIVAYQHDKVPGRFWGRGAAEKGYNAQKGLDLELRTRQDALALIAAPMMGADITRLPARFDLRVRPGKVWGTTGAPKDVLQPVVFNGLEPNSFNQSGDMERMVQMGTGAMDTSTPTTASKQGVNTATGATLMVGAFIKRSKRAMANVTRNFLEPIVRKSMWRYMQFSKDRYPADYKFRVVATNGIMAREFEAQQLTQLMGQVPDDMRGPKMALLEAIIDQSGSTAKATLKAAIEKAMQPDPAAQQQAQVMQALQQHAAQLQVQLLEAQLKKLGVDTDAVHANGVLTLARAKTEVSKGDIADDQVTVDAARVVLQRKNMEIIGDQNKIADRANDIKLLGVHVQNRGLDLQAQQLAQQHEHEKSLEHIKGQYKGPKTSK